MKLLLVSLLTIGLAYLFATNEALRFAMIIFSSLVWTIWSFACLRELKHNPGRSF